MFDWHLSFLVDLFGCEWFLFPLVPGLRSRNDEKCEYSLKPLLLFVKEKNKRNKMWAILRRDNRH
jgi:hypothetical protein